MKVEYKGYKINYNEDLEQFVVDIDDSTLSSVSLKVLKNEIDKLIKKENKFERIDILAHDSYWDRESDDLIEGQITSIAGKYLDDVEVWVIVNKRRSKRVLSRHIYLNNNSNRLIYQQIKNLQQEIKEREQTISEYYDKMEKPKLDI